MTRSFILLAPLGLLVGCPTTKFDSDSAAFDSGTITDTDTATVCTTAVSAITPVDTTADVYYRDPFTVDFTGDGATAVFTVVDGSGTNVPVSAAFTDGNVQAVVTPDAALAPLTSYTLTVDVCGTSTSSAFTTSDLGTPLTGDPTMLLGRTYVFRLSDANITTPAFLNLIAGTYLTVPILLGVESADSSLIHMIGGLGDDSGAVMTQLKDTSGYLPTWDFPAADFSYQPYFQAASPMVTIMYGSVAIPISDFTLAGTFAADGSSIQHGTATGTGDSRNMGVLVGKSGDPAAICDLASSMGVDCTACPDGEPYCLYIVAEDITATALDGVTMTTYTAEDCTDGVDNDGDTKVDCHDADCSADAACAT